MKSLLKTAAITSALLLAPAIAFGQEADATVSTETTVSATAEVTTPPKPRLGPGEVLRQIRETASTTRAQNTAQREVRREEAKVRMEAAKEKAKEKFGAAVQISVGNIIDRLTKHTTKLSELADRIGTRISELQATGKPMTASASLLVTAKADIASAVSAAATVDTTLTTALASSEPKAEMSKVRAAVGAADAAMKAAKQSLQKTLQSVKTEGGASATTETSTN